MRTNIWGECRGSPLVLRSLGLLALPAGSTAPPQSIPSGPAVLPWAQSPGSSFDVRFADTREQHRHSMGPLHLRSYKVCCRCKQSCKAECSIACDCRACRLPGLGDAAGCGLARCPLLIRAAGRPMCKGLVSSTEQLKPMLLKITF